ncbi:corticotropin-releasing factor receptor 2-like [Clavelina lepadiformis]|uniref:corticotropin-releasing factor receptor 2-like n=1 Tax=Clavelina lepadiformis TaxID=159417 RepID=UPI004042F82C
MNFQTVPVVLAFLAAQLMVSGITSINLDKMCANYIQEPHDKENEFLGEKQTSCVIIAEFCQNYTKVPGHCPYVNTHVTNMIPPDVCFPQTLGGGIAYTRCFKKLNGVHYNISFNATRNCESDGRWSRINFTACRPIPDSSDPAEDYVNAHLKIVVIITYVGRGLSLFTLIIAFLLFWRLRSIWCWRNIIHWNLATSLILQNVIWLIHSFFTSYHARKKNEVWFQILCRVLAAISIYSQVATYCWMFVEGVYLHMMVVMAYTYDRFSIKLYMALGWGKSGLITVALINISIPILRVGRFEEIIILHHTFIYFCQILVTGYHGHVAISKRTTRIVTIVMSDKSIVTTIVFGFYKILSKQQT